jgi:uncharacterized membrane protein (GlpM family)
MKSIKEAMDIVLGAKTGGYYLAGFIFCGMAICLSLYISSKKRNPQSNSTPSKFSVWFLIWDNAKRVGATMIVVFLLFRLFDLSEIPGMLGVGFGVSLGLDQIIEWMIGKFDFMKFLQSNREKFPKIGE